ncbi:MAG: hypothetical protein KGL67_00385 [Patescibacteria group bacterium]|nr:hypothetical protein [Patescibacteria group bacterium]
MDKDVLNNSGRVQKGIQAIKNMNLDNVLGRLQQPAPRGMGWTNDEATEADKWYRRFLLISLKYPGLGIVPSGQIDELWHAHILDMRKYEQDTTQIFGKVLYHKPALEDDDLQPQVAKTHALFVAEFGESFVGKAATCDNMCSSDDGGGDDE